MKNTLLAKSLIMAGSLLFPVLAFSHGGKLDLNGGHYYGRSYHCHLRGCEMPDTFSIGRARRDGIMTNHRDREKFFNTDDWNFELDYDNDCQSTRQEMLILTSRTTVRYTNPRNCVVRTGEWLDEYTGKLFNVAVQVDIDHVIPLMYAHTHGGDRWPPEKKLQFANDPINLMLVDKNEIRKKRERGPDRYLPRKEFQCDYAGMWDAIAKTYDLTIETRDRNRIRKILDACSDAQIKQEN